MTVLTRWLSSHRSPERLEHIILLSLPTVVTATILFGQSAYLSGAWQFLAVTNGHLIVLAGVTLSFLLNRRGRTIASAGVLLGSLLAMIGVVPLFISKVAPATILAAALVAVLVGADVLPGRWRSWLAIIAAFALYTLAVEWTEPFPRFDAGASSLPNLYLLTLNGLGLGLILWRIALVALRPSGSIHNRLLVSTVLLVLFTGATITYFTQVVMTHMERSDAIDRLDGVGARIEAQADGWADRLQSSLDRFVRYTQPQLDTILDPGSANPSIYEQSYAHIVEDLGESLSQNSHFDKLAILDAAGATIATVGQGPDVRALLIEACLPPTLVRRCLQPLRLYEQLGGPALVVAEPIYGAGGQLLGVAAGYARAEALGVMMSPEADNSIAITLFAGDATALLALPDDRHPAGALDPHIIALGNARAAQAEQEITSSFYVDERGVPVIGVYHWLPRLQVALLVEQDQTAAFYPTSVALNLHLGVTLLLLTLGGFTALVLVRSITAPLQVLTATAARIGDGDLDLNAEVRQDDELGALARVFNQMTARLRQARDQLEQRVQQRTEELAWANAELRLENAERRRAEEAVQFERNKLKSILDTMDNAVYIVNKQYEIEYANPALEREFGPVGGRRCYAYLYGQTEVCAHCPNERVWRGEAVRREDSLGNGRIYDTYDRPLASADGTIAKLAIFHDVTDRRQAEDEIRRRSGELAVLSRRLVEIQESERQHIARELHDETGQALTSLMLRLGALERALPRDGLAASGLVEIKYSVEEVIEGLHHLAADLRPSSLDHVGLMPALCQYVERMGERHGLEVDFVAMGLDGERLPAEMEITIYRIVQEALVNIVRHAQATQVDVLLERRTGLIKVAVEDNGRGFDVQAGLYTGRLGLIGMRERAEMLGGRLTVDSAPGDGTMVLMEAPL